MTAMPAFSEDHTAAVRKDDTTLPASFAQERLWFLHRLDPGGALYNIPLAYSVRGPLDADCLREAIRDVVERHEALRTNLAFENGELIQIIHADAVFHFEVRDLPLPAGGEKDALAAAESRSFIRRPFDLSADALLRVLVLRLEENLHHLVLNVHHSIFDGVSLGIFFSELSECYAARLARRPARLEPLPIQYGDFAAWQRETFTETVATDEIAFWRERLGDIPPPLELPVDRQPQGQPTSAGGDLFFEVPEAVGLALRDLCQKEGVTPFMALTAAWQALLFRHTGQTRLLTGAPVANRGHAQTDRLIGLFVNTVVLRADFSDDPTVRDLLRRTRDETLGAMEHGGLPFEKLVQALDVGHRDGRNPLFRTMFVLQNHGAVTGFPMLRFEPLPHELNAATLDLLLEMIDDGTTLRGGFSYSTELFDRATVARFAEHLLALLSSMVSSPGERISRLQILSPDERTQLRAWNRTERDFPSHEPLGTLFDEVARRQPEAIAICDGGKRMTYDELRVRADAVAFELRGKGITRGSLVAVPAERSARFVAAVLGIVKTGAAYVPVAVDEASERAAHMQAACTWALSLEQMPEPFDFRPLPDAACAEDPAYVLFTSGSTGLPKGVVVPHRAVSRLAVNNDFAPVGSGDVIAFASNVCFDAATFEIWGALLNGATLAVVTQDVLLSSTALGAFIAEKNVTTLFLTTALFNQIAREKPSVFLPLRHLLFGGEACNPDCVRSVLEHGAPRRLVHVYGPTETTTFATWHLVTDVPPNAVTVPIGQPIANTTVHVLDSRFEPVPPGVTGEIFIGGPGLANGYLNDPALTAERFIATPFGRLYRTGDFARRRADGAIEFRGRADSQMKLRGFRIEPGEIASAIERHPSIRQAAVVPFRDPSGALSLVAYLVSRPTVPAVTADLRAFLSPRLPAYMIPAAFVWLDALPLNPNGKLDTAKLPQPAANDFAATAELIAPRDETESSIARIWHDVLGREIPSVRTDFFALGGHSLLALRMLAAIRSKFGVEVPARALFATPTIEGLAAFLRDAGGKRPAEKQGTMIQIQAGRPGRRPLFLVPGGWGGEIEFLVYGELSRQIDSDLPIWGLKARGAGTGEPPHATVTEMAADYIRELRRIQPHGPYLLAGECVGGICAYEMACQIERAGESVALLVLLDTTVPDTAQLNEYIDAETKRQETKARPLPVHERVRIHLSRLSRLTIREKLAYIFDSSVRHATTDEGFAPAVEQYPRGQKDYPVTLMQHRLTPYRGKVTLLIDRELSMQPGRLGWENAPAACIETHVLEGDHLSYIREHAATAANKIRELLRDADRVSHA